MAVRTLQVWYHTLNGVVMLQGTFCTSSLPQSYVRLFLSLCYRQVWMRCFTPVHIKHRDKLWGALAPSPLDSNEAYAGRWHRQLVCGLVTLFAQVTFLSNEYDSLLLYR